MKLKRLVTAIIFLAPTAQAASHRHSSSDVYVGGHERKDGTYTEPYYRSAPNANKWDNYNYQPSQPQYNPPPAVNRGSGWYQPNPGRLNDNNPNNDAPRPGGSE